MVATKAATARERLLAAANELFYAEGIQAVGIDRIIAHAGVAKASLYATFGSKEALVEAYVEHRAAARQAKILERLASLEEPRAKLLAIFELQAELIRKASFRGCAFVNAWTEEPGESKGRTACLTARAWMRDLFANLARELGVTDPDRLALRLHLLYDAGSVNGAFRQDESAAREMRAMAEMMITAATIR